VLKRLLDVAAANLGHRNVNKAVMAVPAKFNAAQRQATVEAYKQAGLRVMRIIDEPTAAALAYGLDKKPNVNYILVYDFGGGTLDVSLLFVNKESVQVIATHGDDRLGGADFDQCLVEVLHRRFAAAFPAAFDANSCAAVVTGAAATSKAAAAAEEEEAGADGDEVRRLEAVAEARSGEAVLPCSPSNLRTLAERLKRDLSAADVAVAKCVAPTSPAGQGCEVAAVEVTRAAFEAECAPLLARIMQPVEDLLNEALMPREEIDEVVLVGGSSRMPAVRNALKAFFSLDHLNQEIDPDLTIAIGAASIVD
jgi:molecular chaperone DnaK (HSP70)